MAATMGVELKGVDVPPPIQLALYDSIKDLLIAGKLTRQQIATRCDVTVDVVSRIYRGDIPRPKQRHKRADPTKTVVAKTWDRITNYSDLHPRATYQEVAKALRVKQSTVVAVLSRGAKRGTGRQHGPTKWRCPECKQLITQRPCVRCAVLRALRGGSVRRSGRSDGGEPLVYKLPEDAEERRRAVRAKGLSELREDDSDAA